MRATFRAPTCKRCQKEVDEFFIEKLGDDRVRLVARCHDEECFTDPMLPHEIDAEMEKLVAFTKPDHMTGHSLIVNPYDWKERYFYSGR